MSTKTTIIERAVRSRLLDCTINPGDYVITFSQDYRGSKVTKGIFLGVTEKAGTYGWNNERIETKYAIQRDGKITYLNYANIVPSGTTVAELDGCTLS